MLRRSVLSVMCKAWRSVMQTPGLHRAVLYMTVLGRTVQAALWMSVLDKAVLYKTVLNKAVLNKTVLDKAVVYKTVLDKAVV